MLFRIIAVVSLAYIIMAPEWLLNIKIPILDIQLFVFPALLDSLELSQPEFQTIALLNMALILILMGVILNYLSGGKTRNVMRRVVQRIDTLVDFDRSAPQPTAASEPSEEESILDEEEEELSDTEEEEQT